MNNARKNPKVKKTLVRNCEQKLKPNMNKQAVYDAGISKDPETDTPNIVKDNELNEPSVCSSQMFTKYLCDLKKVEPAPLSIDNLNVDKGECCVKMTKKLNFNFNDKIYRNLIELNANVELKNKRDKRPSSSVSVRRDVEPNIEDFYEDVAEEDIPPSIPVIKPRFKPVRKVENGQLHRLVSAFENL